MSKMLHMSKISSVECRSFQKLARFEKRAGFDKWARNRKWARIPRMSKNPQNEREMSGNVKNERESENERGCQNGRETKNERDSWKCAKILKMGENCSNERESKHERESYNERDSPQWARHTLQNLQSRFRKSHLFSLKTQKCYRFRKLHLFFVWKHKNANIEFVTVWTQIRGQQKLGFDFGRNRICWVMWSSGVKRKKSANCGEEND